MTGLRIAAAAAALLASPGQSAVPAAGEAVTYFKSAAGAFERSVTMRFQSLPRVGDEIRAGTNIYRVARVLFVIDGTEATEARLYFERVGPAQD